MRSNGSIMRKLAFIFIISGLTLCNVSCKQNRENTNTKIEAVKLPGGIYGFMCTSQTSDADWYLSNAKAPVFGDLGSYRFPISTTNEEVQMYVNQGMIFAFGFNHAEAARSFYTATKLDSSCAMCYWGYAYVLGPNYNAGMEPDNYDRAYSAIQSAVTNIERCSEKEADLIRSMAARYAPSPPENRHELDSAYSAELKKLTIKYPDDPDIKVFYAESVMDMHPWDLYDKAGEPLSWTAEIVESLESTLQNHPNHPGANHLYIHAVEASADPGRGLTSAGRFDDGLVPNSGHLMHMPSHIYIRTGDYHKGSQANVRAVRVDSAYTTFCHARGIYTIGYYPHNYHFLTATATLEGNSKLALEAADITSKLAHPKIMREPGWGTLQHFYSIPYFVKVKFARWDDILNLPEETIELVYPRAVRHYARGMAFAALNKIDEAKYELKQLSELAQDTIIKELVIWDINPASSIMEIAIKLLNGKIALAENRTNEAIQLMQDAVEIEDALNYDEPPDWFFSIRHHLGEAQLVAGQNKKAIENYITDLHKLPHNGWALHGLSKAYELSGDGEMSNKTFDEFLKSWEYSDVELSFSEVAK